MFHSKVSVKVTHDRLRDAIISERERFIENGCGNLEEINSGRCADFAWCVMEVLSDEARRKGTEVQLMDLELLQVRPARAVDAEDFMGQPFDEALIAEDWPKLTLPADLTWDDMNDISVFMNYDESTHKWLRLGDRHYDCETPDGMENIFDLPVFKRNVRDWNEAGRPKRKVLTTYVPQPNFFK